MNSLFWLFFIFSVNFRKILFVFLPIAIIIGIYFGIKLKKRKTSMELDIKNDPRFSNVKTFTSEANILIIVSDKGYLAIPDYFTSKTKVVNINDIHGYELQINENTNSFYSIGMSIGSIFGNIGNMVKNINSIKIILKINDFAESIIEIPFLSYEIETNSKIFMKIKDEINKFIGTLDYFKNNNVRPNGT